MKFSAIDVVNILILYQSLLFVLFLLFNKKAKPFFIRVLIVVFFLIIIHFGYIIFEKFGIHKNYFFGPFFGLIYGPINYLYVKSLIIEKYSLKRLSTHFIPAFIVLIILLISFFYQSKIIINWLNVIGLIVTIHFIIYLLVSLKLIFNYRKLLKDTTSSFYKISLFWLEIIIYLQLITLFVTLLESYFQSLKNTDDLILIIYVLILLLINCFYYLGLKQVQLFKGFKEENVKPANTSSYTISDTLFNEYVSKLTNYLEKDQPFLEFDISLNDISNKLSISTRNLSYVINKNFNKNFFDFINCYRLNIAKKLLKKTSQPIKEVMYESGFANKATFNAIFKRNTTLTPTQYREKYKS